MSESEMERVSDLVKDNPKLALEILELVLEFKTHYSVPNLDEFHLADVNLWLAEHNCNGFVFRSIEYGVQWMLDHENFIRERNIHTDKSGRDSKSIQPNWTVVCIALTVLAVFLAFVAGFLIITKQQPAVPVVIPVAISTPAPFAINELPTDFEKSKPYVCLYTHDLLNKQLQVLRATKDGAPSVVRLSVVVETYPLDPTSPPPGMWINPTTKKLDFIPVGSKGFIHMCIAGAQGRGFRVTQ